MGKERIDSLMILLQTLPGISFTYNGDELGMEDHEISWEDTRDIWVSAFCVIMRIILPMMTLQFGEI